MTCQVLADQEVPLGGHSRLRPFRPQSLDLIPVILVLLKSFISLAVLVQGLLRLWGIPRHIKVCKYSKLNSEAKALAFG